MYGHARMWEHLQDQGGEEGGYKIVYSVKGLLKKGITGGGESWWNSLVWPIPNGNGQGRIELEGMGGLTVYMEGILIMRTSHSKKY